MTVCHRHVTVSCWFWGWLLACLALQLHNIQGCTVFTGPVAGSVFAREVSGSTLHLVARQLRIHDSTDVC